MLTAQLQGFPDRNQLAEVEATGQPATNRDMMCVPDALADAATYLLGRTITGAQLEDAVYGAAYTGGERADNYASYLTRLGLRVSAVPVASQDALVAGVTRAVSAGQPALIAIPSQWGLPPPSDPVHPDGWTHAVCVYGVGPDEWLAANPWQGQPLRASVAWWRPRCLYGVYYVISRVDGAPAAGGGVSVGLNLTGLGAGFAALARKLGMSQTSGGEHRYSAHEVWAGVSDGAQGVALYWNDQTHELSSDHSDRVAMALWQRGESYRQQAEAASAQIVTLTQECAQARAALAQALAHPPVTAAAIDPATLAAITSATRAYQDTRAADTQAFTALLTALGKL